MYVGLSEFKLADLHLWAVEGIAETCCMMYADQPTGLGPEEVRMGIDQKLGAIRWIDELRAWKAHNRGWWGTVGSLWGMGTEESTASVIKPWTSASNKNITIKTWAPMGKSRAKRQLERLETFGRDCHGRQETGVSLAA